MSAGISAVGADGISSDTSFICTVTSSFCGEEGGREERWARFRIIALVWDGSASL